MSLPEPTPFESPVFLGPLVPQLISYFRKLTGDLMLAEDIAQEAVLVAIQKCRVGQCVEIKKDPGAYLFGIARGLYLRESRRAVRQQTYAQAELPEVAVVGKAEETVLGEQQLKLARAVVSRLPSARDRALLGRVLAQAEKPTLCAELALTPRHFDRVLSRAIRRVTVMAARQREIALAC